MTLDFGTGLYGSWGVLCPKVPETLGEGTSSHVGIARLLAAQTWITRSDPRIQPAQSLVLLLTRGVQHRLRPQHPHSEGHTIQSHSWACILYL